MASCCLQTSPAPLLNSSPRSLMCFPNLSSFACILPCALSTTAAILSMAKKRTKGQKNKCAESRVRKMSVHAPCHIPSHVFHLDMHKTSRPQCLDETWPPCVLEYRILRFTWEVARPCAQSKLHTSRAMCSQVLTAPALDHSCPSCCSCTSPPSTCQP